MNDLELLAKSTSPEAIAASDAFRSDKRHPLQDFEADVALSVETRSGNRQDGSEWSNKVLALNLSNLVVYRSTEPVTVKALTLDVPLPENLEKIRKSSVVGQMVENGGLKAITDINNQRVKFTEGCKQFGERKFTRSDGTEGSSPFYVWFWAPEIVGAGAGSADLIPAEAVEAAISHLNGKTPEEFWADAVRDKAINSCPALVEKINDGSLIAELKAEGKITETDGKLVVTAAG